MRARVALPPTKARLLDAAERLMLAKGFAATSIDDICETAKLTKGSLFHYFESKEQLGRELLQRFCEKMQGQMQQVAGPPAADPLKRIDGYLDGMIRLSRQCDEQTCLLGAFAQELSESHPEIREACAEAFGRWAQALRRDLDDAKARYAPRAAIDTRSLADHLIAVLEGAKILAKASGDVRIVEKSLRHYQVYVHAVFRR